MWTRTFWKLLLEDVIGWAAAAGAGYLAGVGSTDLLDFNWRGLGSAMLLGGLAAFLLGLGKNRIGTPGTPSLVKFPPAPAPVAAPVAEQRRTPHDDAPDWG